MVLSIYFCFDSEFVGVSSFCRIDLDLGKLALIDLFPRIVFYRYIYLKRRAISMLSENFLVRFFSRNRSAVWVICRV